MSSRMLVASGVILAVLAGVTLVLRAPSRAAVNVILITVDTLRADHLGAYGYARQTSPNLDAFAKESVRFEHVFSQSSETNPSLSSLMTSALPFETRVLSNRFKLPEGALTLAEILRSRGYRTAAVVSNFALRRASGFDQGFESYDDEVDMLSSLKWEGMERLAPKTTRAAIDWLTGHNQERFFLWVHYMDPHYPYVPSPPYNTMFLGTPLAEDTWLPFNEERTGVAGIEPAAQLEDRHDVRFYISQYDGEIRFFDESLGTLLQAIRAMGLMDKTLLILAADHGEGMGEHDYYFAHHEFLYQGLIRVPLVVRFPDRRLAGRVVPYPVANVDILPTILETLGIEVPKTARGQNLLAPDERDIYAATNYRGEKATLISGGMKLIVKGGYPGLIDRTELYDLARDPNELINLLTVVTDDKVETVRGLKQQLADVKSDDRLALGAPVEWKLDVEEERKLRALGYVQ